MPQLGNTDDSPENPLDEYGDDSEDAPEISEEEREKAVEEIEEEATTGPDLANLKAFSDTYRISEEDAGFTPQEVFEEMKEGKDREPNELDKEILDGLLIQGHYSHSFEIDVGSGHSFTFRTIGSRCSHNAMLVIRDVADADQEGFVSQSIDNTMLVAQHLAKINGEPTCELSRFASREQIRKRFDRASNLPTPLLDSMGRRVNSFRNRVSDAMERSIENF